MSCKKTRLTPSIWKWCPTTTKQNKKRSRKINVKFDLARARANSEGERYPFWLEGS